jgi:hypothetical protein
MLPVTVVADGLSPLSLSFPSFSFFLLKVSVGNCGTGATVRVLGDHDVGQLSGIRRAEPVSSRKIRQGISFIFFFGFSFIFAFVSSSEKKYSERKEKILNHIEALLLVLLFPQKTSQKVFAICFSVPLHIWIAGFHENRLAVDRLRYLLAVRGTRNGRKTPAAQNGRGQLLVFR